MFNHQVWSLFQRKRQACSQNIVKYRKIAKVTESLTHFHTMPYFDALKICTNCGNLREKRRNCLLHAII